MTPGVQRPKTRDLLFAALAALFLIAGLAGCSGSGSSDGEAADATPCRDSLVDAGEPAPELTLTGPDGGDSEVSLAEVSGGRVTLVDVWATWCKPCLEAMPHLQEMQETYSGEGFTVVGVMSDSNASRIGPEWVAERGLTYPMLFDDNSERLTCQWGQFGGYPTMFLLDRDGTVVDVFKGTGDIGMVERRVEELVKAGAADTDETQQASS